MNGIRMSIRKKVVEKDFKLGYVIRFQYTFKSVLYFLMVLFWRHVRGEILPGGVKNA